MDRADKVIRSTDHDALSCRFNAIAKGYLQDDYTSNMLHGLERVLKYQNKLSHRRVFNAIVNSNKLPVINRGTYIRTKSINAVVDEFLGKFGGNERRRVLSLGAGSDTRPFTVLSRYEGVEYVEFDFEESVKLKHAVVRTDETLAGLVGVAYEPVDTQDWYDSLPSSLETEKYKLVSLDLRVISELESYLGGLDKEVPTLVISECMLCYTESEVSNNIISSLRGSFTQAALVVYDPIGGEGNFGSVMIENLKIRNLLMPSLLEYNTVEKYQQRFKQLGITHVEGDDMYSITNEWVPNDEKIRISKLEFLDEIEELKLLLEHYCLILGYWGFNWDDIKLKF